MMLLQSLCSFPRSIALLVFHLTFLLPLPLQDQPLFSPLSSLSQAEFVDEQLKIPASTICISKIDALFMGIAYDIKNIQTYIQEKYDGLEAEEAEKQRKDQERLAKKYEQESENKLKKLQREIDKKDREAEKLARENEEYKKKMAEDEVRAQGEEQQRLDELEEQKVLVKRLKEQVKSGEATKKELDEAKKFLNQMKAREKDPIEGREEPEEEGGFWETTKKVLDVATDILLPPLVKVGAKIATDSGCIVAYTRDVYYDNALLNYPELFSKFESKFGSEATSRLIEVTGELSQDNKAEVDEMCRNPEALEICASLIGESSII